MTRRSWLRLMAAGVLVVWLCLFLHWDNTEKSMIRALLVETSGDSWTLGLDISGLGAHQALRDGHFALTTKNVCPEIRADVKLMKF